MYFQVLSTREANSYVEEEMASTVGEGKPLAMGKYQFLCILPFAFSYFNHVHSLGLVHGKTLATE